MTSAVGTPARSRPGRRRTLGWLAMLLTAVLGAVGCSAGEQVVTVTQTVTAGSGTSAVGSSATATTSPLGDARFSATPRFGSTDVAPTQKVTVTAFNATITQVSAVSDTDGAVLAGAISEDGGTWTLTDRMAYATTYRITGTATARDGTVAPIDGQLSTVDPGDTMRASFQLAEGGTYGVATPIILTFTGQITDKAAAQQALTVTTDKGLVEGSWGWLQDEDIQGTGVQQSRVHYRTKDYWPANTTVTVTANLYGIDLGGAWGREDKTCKGRYHLTGVRAIAPLPRTAIAHTVRLFGPLFRVSVDFAVETTS